MLHRDAQAARAAICAGLLRGPALRARLDAVAYVDRDAWVDAVCGIDGISDDVDLPPGAVPYLPCAVDAVTAALDGAGVSPDDVFVDLGAGVGRVCLLAHLLTGARCVGVELQPHLAAQGRRLAAALHVPIALRVADAANDVDADADAASVVFVYASFSPTVLREVLQRMEKRPPRVFCAVGFDVDVSWLRAMPSPSPEVALYRRR